MEAMIISLLKPMVTDGREPQGRAVPKDRQGRMARPQGHAHETARVEVVDLAPRDQVGRSAHHGRSQGGQSADLGPGRKRAPLIGWTRGGVVARYHRLFTPPC